MTIEWKRTKDAAQQLGVSTYTLLNRIRPCLTNNRRGKYWRVINPTAKRRTYLWNVAKLEEWQSKMVEILDDQGDS